MLNTAIDQRPKSLMTVMVKGANVENFVRTNSLQLQTIVAVTFTVAYVGVENWVNPMHFVKFGVI